MNKIKVRETGNSLKGVLIMAISRNFLENQYLTEMNSINFQYELNQYLKFETKVSEFSYCNDNDDAVVLIDFKNENGCSSSIMITVTPVKETV